MVEVGHRHVTQATVESILACVEGPDHAPAIPPYVDFDAYVAGGGYETLKECLSGARQVDDVIAALEDSGLKGKGGAGFPTGRKWRFVRAETGPRLMAVNADEGEPGTIKDRVYMEQDPHRFLEGTLIAGWAVEGRRMLHLPSRRVSGHPRGAAGGDCEARRRRPDRADGAHPAPRRRRLHLRRRVGDARKHRGQAGRAQAQAPLPLPGRPLEPANPHQQRRDPPLGARHLGSEAPTGSLARAATGARAFIAFRCRAG